MAATILSERMRKQVEELERKDYRATFYERIDFLLESEHLFEDQPYPLRYGRTLAYILDRISLPIREGEALAGAVAEVVPDAARVERVEALTRAWWDRPLEEIQPRILWFYSWQWLRRRPPWFHSFGHLGFPWERILRLGLGGYAAEAERNLAREEFRQDPARRHFLEGAVLCYRALSAYIRRWARAAGERAAAAASAGQPSAAQELRRIEAACAQLAEGPARSFREALQLVWLLVLPLQKVCGCGVFDLGRMDQYLLPYYRRDLADGTLTGEEARRLVVEFFFKNNEIMSPADHMSLEDEKTDSTLEVTFDDPNYVIVGGLLPGGRPGVNELSHLMVEAQHALRLRNPFMVVRCYPGMEAGFWRKTCAAIRDNATIVLYNDRTMLPALRSCGIAEEDAWGYGFYGCNDPDITGKQGGLRQVWINLVLPLELVLDPARQRAEWSEENLPAESQFSLKDRMNGLMTGTYHGIRTKPLEELRSVEELLEEYRRQLRFLLADFRRAFDRDVEAERRWNAGRIRIEDCFLEGPVERALTWNDGGSRYNVLTVQGSGLATVADSLAAIRKLVFEDREMDLPALARVLSDDFAGREDLRLRLRHRFPKFGNDVEWVDRLAAGVVDVFADEVARQNGAGHLYRLLPTLSTDRAFTTMGGILGATPDGRRRGQPISENQSPTEGTDTAGLTALLNSASRLPFHRVTGGPLNLRVHPSAIRGEEGLEAFAALLETYMEKGGMQVQVNVVSREQLLEAQRDPDKYRGLCVRVVGYSAYFVQMGREAQQELIRRTEKS